MQLITILRHVNRFRQKIRRKKIDWHNFRSVVPVSNVYGLDRGQAVDRYYIEKFLEENKHHVQGAILEMHDNRYTGSYGGNRVVRSDVLDIEANNSKATIITDLTKADIIADETYDCFILTQTLQFIFDINAAIYHAHRILKKGGVLLVTLPCVSRIDCVAGIDGDFWRFTKASADRLFGQYFGKENISVQTFGNVLAGISFLMGLAADELTQEEFDYNDPNFPLIVCVRAVRRG